MDKKDMDDFCKVIESLRQYRRYELLDDKNKDVLNKIYADPLDGDGLLNLCLKDNTTILVGRKGTGKSTIFMRMQNELRESSDIMTCYLDVKTIYDTARQKYININYLNVESPQMIEEYSLQREFILQFVKELIEEIDRNYTSIFEKIKVPFGKSKSKKAIEKLKNIKRKISDNEVLKDIEIQTLQDCALSNKKADDYTIDAKISGSTGIVGPKIDAQVGSSKKSSTEFGTTYNRVFARIFSIADLIIEIQEVLKELSLRRLFVILDDYSEVDQSALKAFCSLIINSLNNNSDNFIKLKISAYPGRVELGEMDRQKIDIRYIDYYNLYASKRDEMESNAVDYTTRILKSRLNVFTNKKFEDYFDLTKNNENDYCKLIFQMSLNVIRHIGLILDYAKDTSIIQGKKISMTDLHDASKKFYFERLSLYFEESRSAQMAYCERAELFQLENLLDTIVNKEKEIKTKIKLNIYSAMIFNSDRTNPYTSHFYVARELEDKLRSLELNFFISKYNEMVDKNGINISIYSLNYGLCEKVNFRWGKPAGNEHRTYFIESPFNFTQTIGRFFSESTKIVCKECKTVYQETDVKFLENYGMKCIKCGAEKAVEVISLLSEEDQKELHRIEKIANLLDRDQFTFLKIAMMKEGSPTTATDMAQEMDISTQKVGWIAKRLIDQQYLIKSRRSNKIIYNVTSLAKEKYS